MDLIPSPEEKQPCQDLVVDAVSETSRIPFTRSCEDSVAGARPELCTHGDLPSGMMNTQLLVVRATGVIDGRISTRLRQSPRKSLIQLRLGWTSHNGHKMTGYLNGRGGGGRRPFQETGESQRLLALFAQSRSGWFTARKPSCCK